MPFAANSIAAIINEARGNFSELPWIEFKTNNADPQTIGEYVSAMANTAAFFGKAHALMIIIKKLIVKNEAEAYNITNLGAILFAHRLSDFPFLERKAVWVIKYTGNNRIAGASREQIGGKGYANGFEGLLNYINSLLFINEVMGAALRKDVPMYPELAVREVVANAIIHQNFFLTGTSPVIEIFDNRMEITNPGIPLIDKERFVDYPPVSCIIYAANRCLRGTWRWFW